MSGVPVPMTPLRVIKLSDLTDEVNATLEVTDDDGKGGFIAIVNTTGEVVHVVDDETDPDPVNEPTVTEPTFNRTTSGVVVATVTEPTPVASVVTTPTPTPTPTDDEVGFIIIKGVKYHRDPPTDPVTETLDGVKYTRVKVKGGYELHEYTPAKVETVDFDGRKWYCVVVVNPPAKVNTTATVTKVSTRKGDVTGSNRAYTAGECRMMVITALRFGASGNEPLAPNGYYPYAGGGARVRYKLEHNKPSLHASAVNLCNRGFVVECDGGRGLYALTPDGVSWCERNLLTPWVVGEPTQL